MILFWMLLLNTVTFIIVHFILFFNRYIKNFFEGLPFNWKFHFPTILKIFGCWPHMFNLFKLIKYILMWSSTANNWIFDNRAWIWFFFLWCLRLILWNYSFILNVDHIVILFFPRLSLIFLLGLVILSLH